MEGDLCISVQEGSCEDQGGGGCLSRRLEDAGGHPAVLIGWQHHQAQHRQKEEAGLEEEPRCRRDAARLCNGQPLSNHAVQDAEGLGICKDEEHKGRIEAIFDFEQEAVHVDIGHSIKAF